MAWKGLHVMYQELSQKEKDDSLLVKYRSVFGSPAGIEVLADILKDMGVMQDLDPRDPVSNALRNYAENVLLMKVGKTKFTAALSAMLENAPY